MKRNNNEYSYIQPQVDNKRKKKKRKKKAKVVDIQIIVCNFAPDLGQCAHFAVQFT